jgi:hypothetical protein
LQGAIIFFNWSIEIGLSLAGGGVPVEIYRKVTPKRIGARCWEICFWSREGK